MTDLEQMSQVVEKLRTLHAETHLEYPGYISVSLSEGGSLLASILDGAWIVNRANDKHEVLDEGIDVGLTDKAHPMTVAFALNLERSIIDMASAATKDLLKGLYR